MAKKKNPILISFVNEPAAETVTGSLVHIQVGKYNILLDAGFYQSANVLEDYKINNRTLKSLKMKNIDYVILSHNHGDHIFYAPILYKRNCKAEVLVPHQASTLLKIMLDDCAHINEKDAAYLSSREGRDYLPLYTKDDVAHFMSYVKELPIRSKVKLNECISVEFIPSGHLLKGCQVVLYIKDGGQTKKILYTGDLGNKNLRQPFTEKFESVNSATIVIGESTYGKSKNVAINFDTRTEDLALIDDIVSNRITLQKGRVLFPVFAQARAETVLYLLYKLYGNDSDFKTKIYIDSPLACRIFKAYEHLLSGKDAQLFKKMTQWENVHYITEAEDSINLVASTEPCIVLSSSGMCSNGRVKYHLKSLLNDANATVVFTGYSTEGSLAWKIRNGDRSVIIDNDEIPVRCELKQLCSLSSHIPYAGMIDYYTNIHCDMLILHHGNQDGKWQLKQDLELAFEQKYLTTKVIASDKNMTIEI